MLCQFSALSMLMLMWSRALTISSEYDKAIAESPQSSIRLSSGDLDVIHKRASTVRKMQHARHAMWGCVVANVVAYCVILGTIIGSDTHTIYAVNLISIAFLCVFVIFGILYVGIKNWLYLRESLQPVYISEGANKQNSPNDTSICNMLWVSCVSCMNDKHWYCLYGVIGFMFQVGSVNKNRLSLQTSILRTLLAVSFFVAFFFSIRALCFLYRPVIVGVFRSDWYVPA